MSTRTAKDDSVFHQNRYASSSEFERGLLGNLVAKRCTVLDAPQDRELVWFIQYLSHRAGGIRAVASDLCKQYQDKIQTKQMAALKLKPGTICNAEQVKKIRACLPENYKPLFGLKGELWAEPNTNDSTSELLAADKANLLPENFSADDFLDLCQREAENNLETYLQELCLDPSRRLDNGPWYFPELIAALREYKANYVSKRSAVYSTELGKKVYEVLDYTSFSRGLVLMEGDARTGKTFAARTWCEEHPGRARYVEVPAGNDDAGFYRALARGLGLGNLLRYKSSDVRDRVESVLLEGDLLLVMDEAQRLWPQRNLRYGFPSRIVWTMTMANAGVPIAMVSTPQFITIQKAVEKNGWNSAQLTGRIKHYESLPRELSHEDLTGVARAVLSDAGKDVLRALAAYAKTSARYLAAIDSISTRARYIAMKARREKVTTDDVRTAMKESVIPADSRLQNALAGAKSPQRISPRQTQPDNSDHRQDEFPRRETQPALPAARAGEAPLIEA